MRIGIDARLAGKRHAGIGRYGEELLRQLVLTRSVANEPVVWVIWLDKQHELSWLQEHARSHDNVELHEVAMPHYGWREQIVWPWLVWRARLACMHVLHFNVPIVMPVPFVVTIHDLLWHQERDVRATTLAPWLYRLKYWGYRLVTQMAARRARAVIVPSQVVACDVATFLGRQQQVHIVAEGVAAAYRLALPVRRKPSNTLLYVGSLYPHKNLRVVLQALRKLPAMYLHIVGARSVFQEATRELAAELGVADRVRFLGAKSDDEVAHLYTTALALVQPSRSEGFGLTGLEALAAGCPVIASDIPIFHEVYGTHVRYFDPTSVTALWGAVQDLRAHPPTQREREAARVYAQAFTWEALAQKTLLVYASVLQARS